MGAANTGVLSQNGLDLRLVRFVMAAAGLVGAAVATFYRVPGYVPDTTIDPFAFRHAAWFGDPLTGAEIVGEIHYLACAGYIALGFFLPGGRFSPRHLQSLLGLPAVLGVAACIGMFALMSSEPERYTLTGGLYPMLSAHVVACVAIGLAIHWIRAAVAAQRRPTRHPTFVKKPAVGAGFFTFVNRPAG